MDLASRQDFARGILVGALLLAIAANLAEFRLIDREAGATYAALNRYPTAEPSGIMHLHNSTVRERFQLYYELSVWAPGADLLLSPEANLRHDQLVGIGAAGALIPWDGRWQLTEDDEARIEAHLVAEGLDRDTGPYALAIAGEGVERLVAFHDGARLLLVDQRLLDGFDR